MRGDEDPFPLFKSREAKWEPGRGTYRANQIGAAVIIIASGSAPIGTDVHLIQSPIEIFPPQFGLFFRRHRSPQPSEVPFDVTATFYSKEQVKTVIVRDADGRHEVRVDQTPD